MHAPFALGLAWPVDHHSTVAAFYRAPGAARRPTASLFVVIRAPAEPEEAGKGRFLTLSMSLNWS